MDLQYLAHTENFQGEIFYLADLDMIEKEAKHSLLSAFAKTPGLVGAAGTPKTFLSIGNRTVAHAYQAGRKISETYLESESFDLVVDVSQFKNDPTVLLGFFQGLALGDYTIGLWKSSDKTGQHKPHHSIKITSDSEDNHITSILTKALAIAAGRRAAMHLVDRPANAKKPTDVASYVRELGEKHDFSVEVLDKEALEIHGFGGILAVGRASEVPPCLLKLHYKGGDSYKLGLVGKGVTFDTGGISIKPSQNMSFMKSDLGGAAAVLGTFISVAQLGLPVELFGLLPVAENAVAGNAYLPSDVLTLYNGATVEVIDTDAEGRLLLADALAYLPEWATPDLTIDLATLTGSAVRTFGYESAALFAHADKVVADLENASLAVDERVWRLPLWDTYFKELKSDVADLKHFHGKPIAGAIVAAKFLEYFAGDKDKWAHLDIAPVAFGTSVFSSDRGATGYGVALLTSFLLNQSNHEV